MAHAVSMKLPHSTSELISWCITAVLAFLRMSSILRSVLHSYGCCRTSHLPVFYAFGRKAIDADAMVKEFQQSFPIVDGRTQDLEVCYACSVSSFLRLHADENAGQEGARVIIYYDVEYAYVTPQIEARLREAGYPTDQIIMSHVNRFYVPEKRNRLVSIPTGTLLLLLGNPQWPNLALESCKACDCGKSSETDEKEVCSVPTERGESSETQQVIYGRTIAERRADEDKKRDIIVFIGEEGPTLTNFLIKYNQSKVRIVQPRKLPGRWLCLPLCHSDMAVQPRK